LQLNMWTLRSAVLPDLFTKKKLRNENYRFWTCVASSSCRPKLSNFVLGVSAHVIRQPRKLKLLGCSRIFILRHGLNSCWTMSLKDLKIHEINLFGYKY
jgi:hypothetical protein